MVILEALNALAGDCLLLRYPGDNGECLWIIDGGPQTDKKKGITVWRQVLLPRLKQINGTTPLPVALGMVSHIDDDHINGIQKVTNAIRGAGPANPAPVRFARFWFNSFDKLVDAKPSATAPAAETAALQALNDNTPDIDDEAADLIMQSVPQGNALASDLRALNLHDNKPVAGGFVMAKKGQAEIDIEGAKVTIIGPLENRLDALRKAWEKALKKPTKKARQAALQELFLPSKQLDKSVPNLSSIVVLVKIGKHKLLLTGDAHGDDVVKAWKALGLGNQPVTIDVLKLPHHGSIRNVTKALLEFFVAEHYVFSADGKHDNPDAPTIEAVVKMHGKRNIVLHFTNEDVKWSEAYKLEKNKKAVRNLKDMLNALHDAYPGPWSENIRKPNDHSVVVRLE